MSRSRQLLRMTRCCFDAVRVIAGPAFTLATGLSAASWIGSAWRRVRLSHPSHRLSRHEVALSPEFRAKRALIACGEMLVGERKEVSGIADAERSGRNAECRKSKVARCGHLATTCLLPMPRGLIAGGWLKRRPRRGCGERTGNLCTGVARRPHVLSHAVPDAVMDEMFDRWLGEIAAIPRANRSVGSAASSVKPASP